MIKQSTTHRLLTITLVLTLFIAALISGTFTTQADENVFENIELKLGESIGLVYYTNQPYTDDTVMRFEINGRKSDVKAIQNDQTCAFVFEDIYPHELAKPIKSTILVNGIVGASKQDITVRDYLLDIILTSDSEQKIKLASNLLQYGEMTREYRNENVDTALQDDKSILEFDETIYHKYYDYVDNLDDRLNGTMAELGIGSHDIRFTSVGISYHNTNQYVVQLVIPSNIQIPPEDIKVRIGEKIYCHEDLKATDTPGTYEVCSEPIHAYNIYNQSILIELEIAGQVVQQARYGCKDYILQLQNVTPDSRAENYAQALYYYGKSASELYQGPTIVAVKPQSEPLPDITLISKQPHKPAPGQGIAYMSDGSTKTINIACDSVEAIQDDTYFVTRDVVGKYTDEINGRVHEVKFTVTLFNPLKEIERHTDPFPYILPSSATMLKPQQCKVLARWANGFEEVRDAEASAITDASIIQSILQKPFTPQPIQLSYTDPKSNITKELPQNNLAVWPLYNPATNVTITNSATLTFDNGTYLSISPDMFTYQATLNNGHTFVTSDVTELGTATFSNAVYTGQEQSGTITIKGTLKQRHSIIGRYQDGELQDNCVFFFDTLNLVADVAFSNPIMSIQIKDFPTCSLSDMNAPTSDNGMLTGGSIYVTLGNGSSQVITGDQVKYEADQGITDTSYSKMVTITATYNNMTAMGNMTITNPIIFMGQSQEAYIPASYYGQAHTTILLEHFANRISIKYANGAMEPITPQALRIVNQADADKLYVPNIRDDSAMTSPLTYAYPDDTLTTGHGLFVAVYKDTREGSNHRTITSGALRYWVVNAPKEFEGNTIVPLLAETDPLLPYLTSVSTIPHSVKLMNGRYKTINITEFAPIPNVQTATEYITATVSVTYTENNQTISGEIYVHVYNPVTAITGPYTDPGNITVTNTSAITSQQLLNNPGLVRVQFHNGLNGVIAPKSFSGLDEVKIEDATLIKQFDIIAQYCTPYGGVNCTSPMDNPVKVILLNPVIDATINVTEGSVSNPIVLSTVSKTAKLNATLYHSNGATEMATNPIAGPCTLYKSGTMNSTEEATNQEEGDVETTLTVSRNSSSSFNRMDAGKATAISTPSWRINKGVKLYWINKPASITVTNISCNVEKHTVKKVTPSATVTVTYENGAIATDKSASAEPVDNITKRTFKEERNPTVTYEASNGHLIETTCTFYLENPIVSIRYAGESEKKLSSSSITINSLYVITWKNERYNTLGDEETEKWGKLVLNITSTDRNISVTNNNTTSPTVKYTGKNTVTTIKCVATWNNAQNDEIGGLKTCTHTITIINEPSFYHNYHSMPSSTRADNLMLTTPVEDGGMTFSPTISLTIRGANGVVMDTVSVFTTESFYKVQGIYEFTSQENGTETNTFSESVCKSATFVYTYNGYRLSTVISCYPRNSVDTYEYKASEPTYKSNGDSYYSASEFTFTAYCYDVFDSGATRYVGTETNQRTSAFYLLYSTSTETIYPHVTKLNSGTVSKHVSSVPHSTVSYKTHYAVELGNISHERYVNGVASGRHDFHPAQITAFSDEYNTYASPFKRF